MSETMRRDAVTQRGRGAQQGFTLVELMVVVAIVALLAALAVPAMRTGNEDEFERAVRTLSMDLMSAKSLSLSRREDHSLIITGPSDYKVQAVWPSTNTFIDPPESSVKLPASTKIVQIKQCADFTPTACAGSTGNAAELRFVGTGELMSCIGVPASCPRALRSMTLYLQGYRNDGSADPKLSRRIVVFSATGFIKIVHL